MKKILIACLAGGILASCSKKLDLLPVNDLTPATTYSTVDGYKAVLAKIYGTLASSGNQGPAGSPDISGGLDEGSQISFIRMYFNCQELPTDEAIVSWNDQTIWDFHNLRWTSSDPFLKGIYARPIYNITLINEYLRESTDERIASHGITGSDAALIKNTRGEARFLRAFNYWVMMDLFGKSTFITEQDGVGAFLPQEISRADLFTYIESELMTALNELPAPRTAEYGRVDKAAAWALLARMYLNAEVYTGTPHWTEALTYAKDVIDAGYTLYPNYAEAFMADNDKAKSEFIFTINCDGLHTTSYGNTTFFIHAASGGDESDYGITAGNGWAGYRATKGLADKFTDLSGNTDSRALFTTSKFDTSNDQIKISDIADFNNGLHVAKYRNIRSDGQPVSDPAQYYADIDFPVFRLSEMYLIYAEAVLRGATGGDIGTATSYINEIRQRAYGNTSGNITPGQLDLNFILDERARELYWEGHRRTDLIRYGLLTSGTYLWPWKGGSQNGTSVADKYNIFPIPATNLTSNSNLTQNPGY